MLKNLKKVVAVLVASSMVLSLGACGKTDVATDTTESTSSAQTSTQASTEKTLEPITFTVYGGLDAKNMSQGIQDDPVMTELTKRTGVTLDFSPQLNVADPGAKFNLMVASGDLADINIIGDNKYVKPILTSKSAIPLDELVEKYGVNMKKYANTALQAVKEFKSDDSKKLYFLPGAPSESNLDNLRLQDGWVIRWDLYKKLGMPNVEKQEDFLKVLGDMGKLEPTNKDGKNVYPLSMFFAESWASVMVDKAIAGNRGMYEANGVYINVKDNKAYPRVTDPNSMFYYSLKFWNKAYQMGLVDPESATLKFDAALEKYKAGRVMAVQADWVLGGAREQFIADKTPEKGFEPVLADYDKTGIYAATSSLLGNQFNLFISTKCKDPDRAVQFLDYLYSVEEYELMENGIEGVHYDIKDGNPIIRPEVLEQAKSDPDFGKKTGVKDLKYNTLIRFRHDKDPRGFSANFWRDPANQQSMYTEVDKDFMSTKKLAFPLEEITKLPIFTGDKSIIQQISLEGNKDISDKSAKAQTYLDNNFARVIFQKNDANYEKEKAKFIADLKALGMEEVEKYKIDQFEKVKASIGVK